MRDAIRWCTFDEITKHLGISRDTLTKLIDEQDFPAYKVGTKYKFDIKEVDDWIKSNRVKRNNK